MQAKRFQIFLLSLIAVAVGALPVQAALTLDETAGTNIVGQVSTTMTQSGTYILPIILAVLLIGGALGLYRVLASKARVRT